MYRIKVKSTSGRYQLVFIDINYRKTSFFPQPPRECIKPFSLLSDPFHSTLLMRVLHVIMKWEKGFLFLSFLKKGEVDIDPYPLYLLLPLF